jgi:hypothetical protein
MSTAGNLLASIAQGQGVSSAKAQRDLANEGYRKDRAALKDTRRTQGIDLRSKNQAAIVSMVSSLLGLAPTGGSGGSGSGGSGGGGGKFGDSFDPWKNIGSDVADFYGKQKTGYGNNETYGSDSKTDTSTSTTTSSSSGTGLRGSHAGTYPGSTPNIPNYSGEDRGDTSGPTIGPATNKKRVWVPAKTNPYQRGTGGGTTPGYWSYQ